MKGLVFGLLISLAAACSPPRGWIPKTTEELVPKYPLILLATLKEGEPRSPSLVGGKKIYDVFCILKGDYRPFPAMITLEDPVNPCVSIPNNAGQSFILGLSRVNDTAFTWWKDAGLETVIHEYTKKNLDIFMKPCDMQKPSPPDGQQIGTFQGNRTCPEALECRNDTNLSVGSLFICICAFLAYNFLKH